MKQIIDIRKKEVDIKEIEKKLQAPFTAEEIEWRAQQQGAKDKPWVMVLAYVQARAIQNRLDEIFGFAGWQDEYRTDGNNIICRLSVKVNNEWIHKENGASETQVEAFKGGISSAFKRVAASGYGIGRYLYSLESCFAETTTEKPKNLTGWNKSYIKEKNLSFWWKTPDLPDWALPESERGKQKNNKQDLREAPKGEEGLCSLNQKNELKEKLGGAKYAELMNDYKGKVPLSVYNQLKNIA